MKFLKLFFFISLSALLLLFSEEVKATHIIGGEINYKCLGNDQYEIRLTVYRDCFYGVPFFDNPASVGFFDQYNNLVRSVGNSGQLFMNVMNNDTLSPILDGRCIVVPPDVCVHTTTYIRTIELPYLEGGYFLSYQRCCRNETILNIIDPDGAGASFTAKITEKALLECNNSASFNEWPPIYICVNEPIEFDHSATDLDGDSLVYKLCEPIMGVFPDRPRPWPPNAPPYPPVNWNEPDFSFENKLGGSDPLKIDPQTGLLTGTPNIVGQFVVGVCVEEYRDGELISTTNRDFQYNVGECHATTAAFFTAESYCDQLEVSFENLSEGSFGEIWYFGGIDNPIDSSFQSDPIFTFPDFGTYDVTLIALGLDSDCNDTITSQVRLLDIGLEPLINLEVIECTDTVSLTLGVEVISDSLSEFTYFWKVKWGDQEVSSSDSLFEIRVFGVDSIYISLRVISTELGCWRTVDLKFPTGLILEGDEMFSYVVCKGETTGLFPDADTTLNYIWSPDDFIIGPSNVPNPTISVEEKTLFTAQLSNEFCKTEISVLIDVLDSDFFTAESYCDQLEVSFESLSMNNTEEIWFFGGINDPIDVSHQSNPTFTFPDFGTYDVTLLVYHLEGDCYDTITKQIRLLEIDIEPLINVEVGECTDTVSLTLGVEVFSDSLSEFTYLWQVEWGDREESSSDSLFEVRVSGVDSIHISLRVISTELGCWRTIELKYPTGLFLEENQMFTNFVCNRDTIGLLPGADTSLNYIWSPENLIIGPSDIPNPTISPQEETLYTAQISNEFCKGEVSVLVGVFDPENDRIAPDTICGSLTVTFDYNPFADFVNRTQWRFESDSTVQTLNADFPTYTFPFYGDYRVWINPINFNYDNCPPFVVQNLHIFDWDFDFDLDVERELCKLSLSVSSSDTLISGSHEYQWVVNGDTLVITGPEFEYEYSEKESLEISVSVMNDYGCIITIDTLIYTGIIPGSTAIDSFVICRGDSLQLEVPFSPNYVYQWEPEKYFLTNSDLHNPSVAPESNISYRVDISNQLCTEIYFVEVEVQFSEFDLPQWVICDELNLIFEVDSLPDVNYHWIFGDLSNPIAESTEINPQIEFDDYGSYPVILILHDKISGCRDTLKSVVQLINSELWSLNIEVNRNECEFNKVRLELVALLEGELPDGEFTFDWKISGDTVINLSGDSIDLDLTGVEYLEIELTVTDSLGCSHSQTIEFNYNIFEFTARDTISMCEGDTVLLNPDFHSDYDYIWSPATGLLDGVTHSNPAASPASTILYTANIFNGSCTGEKEVLVIVNENPAIVSLTAEPATMLPGDESMLFADVQPPGATILWSPAESLDNPNIHNPLATPMETTTYFITVTSEEGCTTVDSITVFVQDLPCEIPYVFLPNAFSPNGDGMNDVLYVLGDHIERFVLIIYNRWGQEVFRTVELDRGWNGQFRGEDLPPDVYGFYLEVECIGGAHFSDKGNVSLIR